MKKYKILLLQLGQVLLEAESEDDALAQLAAIPSERIEWLSMPDSSTGVIGPYVIASIKIIDAYSL